MSFIQPPGWRAPDGCPEHLRHYLETLVNSFPPEWLNAPFTDEMVANLAEGERRLRAYAVANGFDVVRTGGGSSRTPACLFKCIHHGHKTANKRKLEDRIERYDEGKIISRRQRKTRVCQTGCTWAVRISHKLKSRDEEEREWVLSVNSLDYEGH